MSPQFMRSISPNPIRQNGMQMHLKQFHLAVLLVVGLITTTFIDMLAESAEVI